MLYDLYQARQDLLAPLRIAADLAGTLLELPVVACAFEFQFLGGSMGSVVGERFKRGVDHCIEHRKPGI